MGQFVWTGFDYLGEPSPYDTNAWPSHSSVFGIIDLASIPKDRYYLYRSIWNRREHTLHVLPHWTWPSHEGQVVPVFVYTDAPAAELFVNGKSQGIQYKYSREEALAAKAAGDSLWLQRRYRLMWTNVKYEPGEIKVVAHYPGQTNESSVTVKTAGRPHHLELIPDRTRLAADGEDLCYVTVRVVDRDGNLIPDAADLVSFKVKGAGRFRAAANGDASNLDLFHLPQHHAFAGQLTAIVQSSNRLGTITLEASAKGLKKATLVISGE
jgi:beta-galactosidase